jgi:hypothetical protein
MIVGLEVFEDEGAELTIRAGEDEFVIQISREDGKVYLILNSGHFEMDALNAVVLGRGLGVLQ